MPIMTKRWTPDLETAEIFATYAEAARTERELKPDVRERAAAALKAGATGTQLARLTGMTPEVFRRMARDLDLPIDPRYRDRAEASRRKPTEATPEQAAPEPREQPSREAPGARRAAAPPVPAESAQPREVPWPVPLPDRQERATATMGVAQWIVDLDDDTTLRLLDRARKDPSYDDVWRMFAQSRNAAWAGLLLLHSMASQARRWLDEEQAATEATD